MRHVAGYYLIDKVITLIYDSAKWEGSDRCFFSENTILTDCLLRSTGRRSTSRERQHQDGKRRRQDIERATSTESMSHQDVERSTSTERRRQQSIERADSGSPEIVQASQDVQRQDEAGGSLGQTLDAVDPSNDPGKAVVKATLDNKVLSVIGERFVQVRALAPPIHEDLAERWEEIVKKGLPEENKLQIIKKYPPPTNCTFIDPPKINPEVKEALQEAILKRDMRIAEKQAKISTGLAAVGKALCHRRR